ncbi:MAG: DUF2344 domain-containing protein [Lachnospiraceae bacterium]|nr:DUF2344 domain-containing protein [Lachnospiraceae bacterium]
MSDHVKLRVKFQKTGAIRFIGHLDVMRFFQKCTRRAQIPVCYTGGFSPHQILTFAAPLSVGLESYGEYMDVEVESVTSSEDIMNRLNQASVPEIKIVSVKRLPENAGNAMASVAAAKYLVTFRDGKCVAPFDQDGATIQEAISDFLSKEQILYEKESKKGKRELDLKPGIFSFTYDEKQKAMEMLLDASSGDNIKPSQVLDAMLKLRGTSLPENSICVVRLDTYTRTSSDDENPGELISMDEVGEVF